MPSSREKSQIANRKSQIALALLLPTALLLSCTQQNIVMCKANEGFDSKTGKCYPCPAGTKLDKKSASCVQIPGWDAGGGDLVADGEPDVPDVPGLNDQEPADAVEERSNDLPPEVAPIEPGSVGAGCKVGSDCSNGGMCFDWPLGYCIIPDCKSHEDCPEGAWCLPLMENSLACFDGCESDKECRSGYGCKAIPTIQGQSKKACHPAQAGGKELGVACAGHEECVGDLACVKLGPQGMCTTTACSTFDPCPEGAACIEQGSMTLCMPSCSQESGSCDESFTCQEASSVEGGKTFVCSPAKQGLAIGELCYFHTECESGVCYPLIFGKCSGPFGNECGSDGDCDEGLCVPNPSVVKGVCSKECGPQDPCPTGSWCVVGAQQDAYCAPNCTNKAAPCGPQGMGLKCTYGKIFYPSASSGMYACVKTMGGEAGAPCNTDGDCPGGGVCYGAKEGGPKGWCATPCVTAKDCPFGSECQDGTVVSGKMHCTRLCQSDQDCPEGFSCLNTVFEEAACLLK